MRTYFIEFKNKAGIFYEQIYIRDWSYRNPQNLIQIARSQISIRSASRIVGRSTGNIYSKQGAIHESNKV